MPRRKRGTRGELFKNHLHLSSHDFSTILADFEPEIGEKARNSMQDDLAIAFAYFRGDRRVRQRQLKPNELKEDLKQVKQAAAKLVNLLNTKREAADAMARAMQPDLDNPTLSAVPMAPPIFQRKALEIESAAKQALAKPPKHMPYIDSGRGDAPMDWLVEQLLRIWETHAGEAPTFMGDNEGNKSPFVRFALACCRQVGSRLSASALSTRATRLYAALPGPKLPKRRRSRGPTRKSTGHVVRKKKG